MDWLFRPPSGKPLHRDILTPLLNRRLNIKVFPSLSSLPLTTIYVFSYLRVRTRLFVWSIRPLLSTSTRLSSCRPEKKWNKNHLTPLPNLSGSGKQRSDGLTDDLWAQEFFDPGDYLRKIRKGVEMYWYFLKKKKIPLVNYAYVVHIRPRDKMPKTNYIYRHIMFIIYIIIFSKVKTENGTHTTHVRLICTCIGKHGEYGRT